VNEYRNILTHLHRLTTHQRPKFEPIAMNTDWKSQGQTLLAKGILDYYMREKRIERYLTKADEDALVYGEGFIELEWDQSYGDLLDFDQDENQKPVMTGDIRFWNLTPNNLIRDCTKETFEEQNWIITRKFVNRFDLAAKYPSLSEEILNIHEDKSTLDNDSTVQTRFGIETRHEDDSDDIAYYTFYHRKTDALPEGKLVVFLNDQIKLINVELPYDDIPVFRCAPTDQDGIPFGYSVGFDLLPIQDHLDYLFSVVLTNQRAFGVQNITAARGSNMALEKLGEGLNLLEYSHVDGVTPPAPMEMLKTPSEIFTFIKDLQQEMETISGVNSVVRGDPQASIKSGAALALVQAQSIQFNSGQQQSYYALLEDVGTSIINILKKYANTQRMVTIAGKSQRHMIRSYTKADLVQINRVTVNAGNPLSGTPAGRLELARDIKDQGFITTPEEYMMLLQTGELDTVIEGDTAELMLIRAENESLVEGMTLPAIVTDNHNLHLREHKAVISTPEARLNEDLFKRTAAHIQEHINLLQTSDPYLLSVLGQVPYPGNMIQPVTPQPQGGGFPQGGGNAVPMLDATPPVQRTAEGVQLPSQPSQPTNPLTGNQWNSETGGM